MQKETTAVEANPFEKTFTLPLSKKKVVMTSPLWGKRREVRKMAQDMNLDEDDTSMALIAASTAVDGLQLLDHTDFDQFHAHDVMKMINEFNDWESKAGPNGKN